MATKKVFIERVLNNNSILVKESNNNTTILIGKGLGFNKKNRTTSTIDTATIDKSFVNYDETTKNQLIEMINTFDEDIIEASNDIIELAEKKFGELNQHIYISLTDHICFALDRLRKNQVISNPFQEQIQSRLLQEYTIAKEARSIIEKKFNLIIPDDEIGFIAFHINAARENTKVTNVVKEIRVYKKIIQIIETEMNKKLAQNHRDDLYTFIESIIKKKHLPLGFLVSEDDINQFNTTPLTDPLLKKIVNYLDSNTDIPLTPKNKLILNIFINHIKG
jgi:transcriptional antiterminator